jgi:nucleotide-binding universal stress UspA family protein
MKLLVGYEASRVADEALTVAHKYAKAFDAEVFIVTSLEQSPTLKKEDIDKAESRLEKVKRQFTSDEISCEAHASVSYQSPGEDLVNFAKEQDIDAIFLGVRRRSKVGKLVFGSTAQYVILEAPCPVVSVK